MNTISSRIERIIAGLVLGVAFLVMASIIVPHNTQATPNDHPATRSGNNERTAKQWSTHADTPSDGSSTDPHEGLLEIGSIESSCYLVRIYAGEVQPLYTIIDITDGGELATLLTAEQVEATFPDLPITTMEFDTIEPWPGQPRVIMLADPAELYDFQ